MLIRIKSPSISNPFPNKHRLDTSCMGLPPLHNASNHAPTHARPSLPITIFQIQPHPTHTKRDYMILLLSIGGEVVLSRPEWRQKEIVNIKLNDLKFLKFLFTTSSYWQCRQGCRNWKKYNKNIVFIYFTKIGLNLQNLNSSIARNGKPWLLARAN